MLKQASVKLTVLFLVTLYKWEGKIKISSCLKSPFATYRPSLKIFVENVLLCQKKKKKGKTGRSSKLWEITASGEFSDFCMNIDNFHF